MRQFVIVWNVFHKMVDSLKRLWLRFIALRFLIVGAWNFIFGYGAFAGLYWLLKGSWPDWLISVIATVLGITMSFVTHRFITYRSHGCWWKEYLRFYVVYGVQSLLNVGLIVLLVTHLKFNAYIVQLVITLLLTILSFWAHKLYSFKSNNLKSDNLK